MGNSCQCKCQPNHPENSQLNSDISHEEGDEIKVSSKKESLNKLPFSQNLSKKIKPQIHQLYPAAQNPLKYDKKSEIQCCICIQKHWRGYILRRRLKDEQKNNPQSNQEVLEGEIKQNQIYFSVNSQVSSNQADSQSNHQLQPVDRILKEPLAFKNEGIYTGEWKGEMRDGYGSQVWPDGAKYEGNWRNNKANGKGRFEHINGDIYEGEWVQDKACGYGVYNHANGALYEGFWKDNLQHGQGKEQWPNQNYYVGEYFEGKKQGKGKYDWNDGSFYEGEWFDNQINGFGRYIWPDGRGYEGTWKDNNMHGKGTYTWGNGRSYQGEYKNDKKHGYGIYKWVDGRRYEGGWKFGRQDGEGTYYMSDGTCRRGIWKDGERINWFEEQSTTQKISQ